MQSKMIDDGSGGYGEQRTRWRRKEEVQDGGGAGAPNRGPCGMLALATSERAGKGNATLRDTMVKRGMLR